MSVMYMIRTLGRKYNQLKIRSCLNKNRARNAPREAGFLQGHRFLCLLLSAIGDAIMAQPAWTMLKASIPEATIDLVCWPHLAGLFRDDPAVNRVLVFEPPRGKLWRNRDVFRLAKIWKNARYDFVIDFAQIALTAVACAFKSSPYSVGLQKRAERSDQELNLAMAYDQPIPYSESDPIRDVMFRLVKPWVNDTLERPSPRLHVSHDTKEAMNRWLREKGITSKDKFIILAPGAKWPPKCWPSPSWTELLNLINRKLGTPPIFLGGPEDKKILSAIMQPVNASSPLYFLSEDLALSAALIQRAALCVCNDSASMHIAAAVGTPSVALFGPVSPSKSAPSEDEGCHVLYEGLFCSPCTLYYSRERCRRGLNFCMYALPPERVYREIGKLIESSGKANEQAT
jgi:ADP-heptose:LPS heptosyltransferase